MIDEVSKADPTGHANLSPHFLAPIEINRKQCIIYIIFNFFVVSSNEVFNNETISVFLLNQQAFGYQKSFLLIQPNLTRFFW